MYRLNAAHYDIGYSPIVNRYLVDPDIDYPEYFLSSGIMISIESRNRNGTSWAICQGRMCFSKSYFDFVYESTPSNREDSFIEDTRFESPEEALSFWLEHWVHYAYHYEPLGKWVLVDGKPTRADLDATDLVRVEEAKEFYKSRNIQYD